MDQESITAGLTTPVNVIIAFLHLGFHVFNICHEKVEDEACFSSEYMNMGNVTSTVLPGNKEGNIFLLYKEVRGGIKLYGWNFHSFKMKHQKVEK